MLGFFQEAWDRSEEIERRQQSEHDAWMAQSQVESREKLARIREELETRNLSPKFRAWAEEQLSDIEKKIG